MLQTGLAAQRIAYAASDDVRAVIAGIGRTEDVQFSPDQKRLAIAGFALNRLLILDVTMGSAADRTPISLTGFLEIVSATFNAPHGVAWIDDRTLAVANREGQLSIIAVPAGRPKQSPVDVEPLRVFGGGGKDLISTPGSVSVAPVGLGLIEVLVCNNYADQVTRHLLDQRDGYAVVASGILIDKGIQIPDGVARSRSGQWIAISNYDHQEVFLFRNNDSLNGAAAPQGVLIGVQCPHGMKFSADGKVLLVADAGAPFIQIFRSEDGDWTGEHAPSGAIRAVGDLAFARGNYCEGEGGPKGIDLSRDNRVMVTTCEEQHLAFFDVGDILGASEPPADRGHNLIEAQHTRDTIIGYLTAAQTRAEQETAAIRKASQLENDRVRRLMASRSWRLTAPLRWMKTQLQAMNGKRRRWVRRAAVKSQLRQ